MHAHPSLPTARRILAVEDDPVLAAHLDSHLGQRGFDVTLRQNGVKSSSWCAPNLST